MASPTPPTYVAPGELITSAWGNAVVDMLVWLNTRRGVTALGSISIAAGAVQSMSWQTLSTPDWGAGPTLIAPASTTGLYLLSCNVTSPVITAGADADCIINVGSTSFRNFIPGGKTGVTVNGFGNMVSGDQVSVQIYNPNATAQFFNASLNVFAVAP